MMLGSNWRPESREKTTKLEGSDNANKNSEER